MSEFRSQVRAETRVVVDGQGGDEAVETAGRILIVDDVADNRNLLARRFQRRGFEVLEAEGGRRALQIIAAEPLDLVLLDVRMPDMDGREVLQQIRVEHSPVLLPVIMVTGNAGSDDVVEALQLGANDYLTKPVDIAVAVARVETQIGRKRAEEAVWRSKEDLERRIAERTADLAAANQELRQATAIAQAANRSKDEFLTNMSHELRTPLNGVIGMAQTLGATELSSTQREMLQLIETSAGALQSVVSDLLDIVDLDSGVMEIAPKRFLLGDLVRSAASSVQQQAVQKGLEFEIRIDGEAEGQVETDAARLRQILLKVLSNAVKFTAHGEVAISVTRPASEPDNVIIAVTDTGIGFDPAAAERLFERFEQADGSLTRPFEGAGLGLAICREVVQLLGGTISAEGRPGEGATFTMELPLPKVETDRPRRELAEPSDDGPMRILCAEDHPINRQLIEYILTTAGVSLVSVENGAQAVEAFKAEPFDAVLMDMQMPVMDGLAATRAIRAFEASLGRSPTPVVMVTAHGLPEHIRTSLAAGADRHVTKPFVAADLLTVLAELSHASELAQAS